MKFSDEVSNSDDVAESTRWPCRGGKRQIKLMIHRWSTLHDMIYIIYIYIYYDMKSLEKHLRFVHQKEHLTDVKTWSLHSDTSTTALWRGGYSLKQQLWTHSVWCFKCASGNASSSILGYGSSIERQFMLASMTWIELFQSQRRPLRRQWRAMRQLYHLRMSTVQYIAHLTYVALQWSMHDHKFHGAVASSLIHNYSWVVYNNPDMICSLVWRVQSPVVR